MSWVTLANNIIDYALPTAIALFILGMALMFLFSLTMSVYYLFKSEPSKSRVLSREMEEEIIYNSRNKQSQYDMSKVNETIKRDRLDSLVKPEHYGAHNGNRPS